MTRIFLPLALIAYTALALAGIVLLAASAGAQPAHVNGSNLPLGTPTPCTGWSVVASLNVGTGDNQLYGVAAVSANDVWAVGNYFNTDGHAQTLIEHWNGTAWGLIPSPNPGTANNFLFGVSAVSASDIWAVGWYQNTSIQQPLTMRWNGSAWTVVPMGNPDPGRSTLFGVSAISANDAWAVGQGCETAMCQRRIPIAIHWDGTQWANVTLPNIAPWDNYLNGVSARASNDVWAVGQACTDNGCPSSQTLIEHWNGAAWSIIPSQSPGSVHSILNAVSARAVNDAWAVGQTCADAGCASARSLIEHWDGTAWTQSSSPNPGTTDTHLNGVTAIAANDAWAVGSYTNDGSTYGNAVMHWDGTAWRVVAAPNPGAVDNDLRAVAKVSASDVWAVGDQDGGSGERTQTQHYTGPCVSTPTATVVATATACAVWGMVTSPNVGTISSELWGAAAVSANDAWAVGQYSGQSGQYSTLTEHWNGTAWSVIPSPNQATNLNWLFAAAAPTSNDVWAVGQWRTAGNVFQTLIIHWDGSAWNVAPSPNQGAGDNSLYAITAASASDIWAVGSFTDTSTNARRTLAMHYDGSAWSIVSTPNVGSANHSLLGVSARASNDVWAVGYGCPGSICAPLPLIEHWNGTAWSVVSGADSGFVLSHLTAVSARAANDVWAVGWGCPAFSCSPVLPLIERWDGSTWTVVPSPAQGAMYTYYYSVVALSGSDAWAAGNYSNDGSVWRSAATHWDGSSWSAVPVSSPGTQDNTLWALAAVAPNDIWAVGEQDSGSGPRTLIQHYAGTCPSTPTPAITATPTRSATRTPAVTLTPCVITFSDVHPTDYFYEAVRYLYCHGVISGYQDNTFRPFNNTTRGQLTKIVVLAEGWTQTCTSQTFSDVPPSHTFYCYVETAVAHGIISGYADGTFKPGNDVTRGQLAKIVVLAEGWADECATQHFSDVPPGSTFFCYVETAFAHGIISGYADGTFRPGNNATRGQISKIVYQAITQP
jgi:hypothetical protein